MQTKSFQKFILLWIGEWISAIGSGLSAFGLGVYIFNQTGKASDMALITLLGFMPALLLSPIAGVLADRHDRRLLMVIGDSFSVLGLVFILWCMLQGEAKVWQIGVGVTISAIFSSLVEPAYRATITDLLTEDQYMKASGLVQIAGSSKYLISPALAGILLYVTDVKVLLLIDACTFFVTVFSTLAVRKGIEVQKSEYKASLMEEFKEGFKVISSNRGVWTLVWLSAILTFCMGFIQTLAMPMILAFETSTTVGLLETVVAFGMLISSIILGMLSIKGGYVKILASSLFGSGIFMILFGLRENIWLISGAGFLFFAMLPFANASLDYLVRTHIDQQVQGRAWGLIGLISQLGYIGAYAISGVLADYVFTPLLVDEGLLANSVGKIIGTGSGRGTGFLIMIAGMLMAIASIGVYHNGEIQNLERGASECI